MGKATNEQIIDLWKKRRERERNIADAKANAKTIIDDEREHIAAIDLELDELTGGGKVIFDQGEQTKE